MCHVKDYTYHLGFVFGLWRTLSLLLWGYKESNLTHTLDEHGIALQGKKFISLEFFPNMNPCIPMILL
jgi:hypothetical protein